VHSGHGPLIRPGDASRSLLEARDDLEARLLLAPRFADAASAEGAGGFGNIVGVGIGVKEAGGKPAGRPAVKVFVKEKLPARRISSETRVPRTLGGIATDVDACGEVRAHGILVGRDGTERVGTLACLVTAGGRLHVLGTNHVLALVNRGPIGAPIRLRGKTDRRDRRGGVIGRLSRFLPIAFDADNEVDAAMARTSPSLLRRVTACARGIAPPAPGARTVPAGSATSSGWGSA